jgi:hypothetical protein
VRRSSSPSRISAGTLGIGACDRDGTSRVATARTPRRARAQHGVARAARTATAQSASKAATISCGRAERRRGDGIRRLRVLAERRDVQTRRQHRARLGGPTAIRRRRSRGAGSPRAGTIAPGSAGCRTRWNRRRGRDWPARRGWRGRPGCDARGRRGKRAQRWPVRRRSSAATSATGSRVIRHRPAGALRTQHAPHPCVAVE